MIVGKMVVKVASLCFKELEPFGLTQDSIAAIQETAAILENAIIDHRLLIGERHILKEKRINAGNLMYETLIQYTNAGKAIWQANNVAKHNDYMIYDIASGHAEQETS